YKVATSVSYALIEEGISESNIEDIEYMSFLYNELRDAIKNASQRHNKAIEDSFQITLANYSNLLYSSLLLTILSLSLITLISLFTTKSITRPLDKLVELANRFSKGDFSAEVDVNSFGEIGVLSNAFHKMTHEIRLLITEKDKAFSTVTLSKEFIEQNAKQLEELNEELKSEIDERKKAEEELNKHRSQLEEMIEERTSELSLANTELLQEIDVRKKIEARQLLLNKSLESANQELKSFAYVVSHDLKAPLRAIGSLTDWLSNDYMDKLDEEGQNLLTLLVTRVKRMHRLIEGILEYSRLGRIREEKRDVDLNKVVSTVLDIVAPPPEIKICIQRDLPTLVCEKTRIIQVFQNLIGNAVKYMDKPKGKVDLKYTGSESNWIFSIADNGCGIDKKHFHKIFQIFQTLRARDEFESTGIGLPLVKRIIEMYGGEIWLESEPGIGTTFYFTLPKKGYEPADISEPLAEKIPGQEEQVSN
ncbi:MAG: ATP-binding protein, partial [Calditrichota bacterium]